MIPYFKNNSVLLVLILSALSVITIFMTPQVIAHHESCSGIQSADRIVECNQQQLRIAYSRCESQHSGDDTAIQNCKDDAARHQGIDPSSSNATPPPARTTTRSAGTGTSEIDSMLATGVNILTGVAGLAIVGSIIFGGIQYSSAGGNASQVSAAKNRIVVSIASLLLLGFGYAILQWLVPGGIFN